MHKFPSKKRVITPYPFDIACEIIANADTPALIVLSLVNRDYYRQSIRYLWRSLGIGPLRHLSLTEHQRRERADRALREFLRVLKRNPHRISFIRSLTLRPYELDRFPPPFARNSKKRPAATHDVFEEILHLITNIVHLSIDEWMPDSGFGNRMRPSSSVCLSTARFSFKLTEFETTLRTQHIEEFLASQPGITSYVCSAARTGWPVRDVSPLRFRTLLPLLESITADVDDIKYLVPGHPIHTVRVTSRIPSIITLRQSLEQSTVPVTHLHLPHLSVWSSAHALARLSGLPSDVSFLEASINSGNFCRCGIEKCLFRFAQQSFHILKTLVLWDFADDGWPPKWKVKILTRAHTWPVLRRVELKKAGTPFQQQQVLGSVVFVRSDSGGKWTAESGCVKDVERLVEYGFPA